MQTFAYARAVTLPDAIGAAAQPDGMLIAGGTELLNWMKEGIVAPRQLIDINGISGLDRIEFNDSGLKIGALARMSDVARHDAVDSRLSGGVASAFEERLAPNSQHGFHGR